MGLKLKKRMRNLCAGVVMFFFAISFVLPILITITNSFMSESEIQWNYCVLFGTSSEETTVIKSDSVHLQLIPESVTLSQYKQILLDGPEYLYKFWNSVIMVVPIVVLQVVIAVFASYGFSKLRGKAGRILPFVYMILMVMPYQVLMVSNYIVLDKINLVDTIWAIILPGMFAPYSTYILTKRMKKIPKSYIEAAKIDGAGEWALFTKICVPLCASTIMTVLMLVFFDYWNMVEQPIALLSNSSKQPLSVFLSKINSEKIGVSFAAGVIYMIYPLLLFLYGEKNLESEIASTGGLKDI